MTNSPDYHPATDFQASTNVVPGGTSKVHGWLLGMQEYESGLSVSPTKASETSAAIGSEPAPRRNRPFSISSISSEDSVNLEDLIKANYTSDMDDETALSDLAELDLDDSDEEFWKLDTSVRPIPQQSSSIEDRLQSLNLSSSPSPQQSNSGYPRSYSRHRSGSQSSENSFTSQSTITITSHHLRGNRASHIPLPPRPASQLSTQSTQRLQPTAGMLQQSRSSTDTSIARPSSRIASHTQSRLAKRASHIPTPSSIMRPPSAAPAPQHTLSTRSTTATNLSGAASRESSLLPSTRTPSRLANRASHIPATTASRAKSPIPSRIAANGQRSSGIFSSGIFGSDHSRMQRSTTVHTPSPTKSTGAVRSSSRIGMTRRAL